MATICNDCYCFGNNFSDVKTEEARKDEQNQKLEKCRFYYWTLLALGGAFGQAVD